MEAVNVPDLIDMAYNSITRVKGKSYAPSVHEIQYWINNKLNNNVDTNKQ